MDLLALRWAAATAVGSVLLTAVIGLGAEPVSEHEAQQVRLVIVTQLQALDDDDADGAFETTTPAVREAIGNPWHFLVMMRLAYPMVYHSTSVTFMRAELLGGAVLQLTEILDEQGKSWLVLFSLERQPDAAWRIDGCTAVENRWLSI